MTGKAPKAELLQNQPGFNAGGPITIPGLLNGHDKAFFFFNYEDSRSPSKITRTRDDPDARRRRRACTPTTLAAARRPSTCCSSRRRTASPSTLDPVDRQAARRHPHRERTGSIVTLPIRSCSTASFQVASNNYTPYPLGRVDYNMSKNHRLTGSFNYNHVNSTPDTTNNREPFFPGFPEHRAASSRRATRTSESLRSTFGANTGQRVPRRRLGRRDEVLARARAASLFGGNSFGDQGGYYLNIGNGCCSTALTNAGGTGGSRRVKRRRSSTRTQLNWLSGKHSLAFGGGLTQARVWLENHTVVPRGPLRPRHRRSGAELHHRGQSSRARPPRRSRRRRTSMRSSPAASARSTANARLDDNGQYQFLGDGFQRGKINQWGFFAQDNWRVGTI